MELAISSIMQERFLQFLDYFLFDEIKEQKHRLFQFRLLLSGLIFIIVSNLTFGTFIVISTRNFPWEHFISFAVTIPVFLLLKFLKNVRNVGIFVCTIFLIGFAVEIPNVGGIYADSMQWLCMTPMFAIIFINRKAGVFVLALVLGFLTYIYIREATDIETSLNQLREIGPFYTYMSYFTYFICVFIVIVMFSRSNEIVVEEVNEKNKVLENQKKILEQQEIDLRRMNSDMESFAYIASHDLKEPLRMIGVYTQLIKKRIDSEKTENLGEFIGYVTDGVQRMETMLNDILQYSLLGKASSVEKIDLNDIILLVKNNLMVVIKSNKAKVEIIDELPTLSLPKTEIIQLFQNLIANSIKFRKKEIAPVVHILCKKMEHQKYHFGIKDNGIGIKKEFYGKIFGIFERLHTHQDYQGSGIGLASCRKIVESLGGKIWIESVVDEGTTIWFEIPEESISLLQNDVLSAPSE
jgi:signal transduction histidine kinase